MGAFRIHLRVGKFIDTEVYQMIDTIFNEDCLIGMRRIPDKSIDMVLCDLPYGVLNKGNVHAKWDSPLPMDRLWEQYRRICKDDAPIVLFGQGMFTAQLMMSNPKMWRYNLIWQKTDRPTGFLNAKKMPLREHEDIMVFYDKLPVYHPQMVKCEPHQRNHSRGKMEKEQTNRCYGQMRKFDEIITDEKYPRSIIRIPREANTEHPTQKPVALCEWLIRTYSDEGDTILDNCMGGGSTAIACKLNNRHYIGFETSKEYCEMAERRLKEVGENVTIVKDGIEERGMNKVGLMRWI